MSDTSVTNGGRLARICRLQSKGLQAFLKLRVSVKPVHVVHCSFNHESWPEPAELSLL